MTRTGTFRSKNLRQRAGRRHFGDRPRPTKRRTLELLLPTKRKWLRRLLNVPVGVVSVIRGCRLPVPVLGMALVG